MRFDFKLYDESGFWWLAPAHLGGYSLPDFINKVSDDDIQDLLDRQALLPITMYGDGGGMRMRIVFGELTPDEQENWTARTTASLDLSDGKLLIGTSCDPDVYDDEPAPYSLNEVANGNLPEYGMMDFSYLAISPGLYRADVYCFPPHDLSATWKSIISPGSWAGTHAEAEPLATYFRRTRSNEEMPSWIGYELRLDGVINDDRFQDPQLEKFLEFLIHLTPIEAPLPHPNLSEGGYTIWETRKPSRCPVGVVGNFPISTKFV